MKALVILLVLCLQLSSLPVGEALVSDRYMFDMPVDGVFSTSEAFDDYTAETGSDFHSSSPSDVYAMFDALVAAHPGYASRTLLGHEPSASGYPVYLYTFMPAVAPARSPGPVPKVFLTCGTRGQEKASTLSAYLF